jgi:hypothetical protein
MFSKYYLNNSLLVHLHIEYLLLLHLQNILKYQVNNKQLVLLHMGYFVCMTRKKNIYTVQGTVAPFYQFEFGQK